MIFGEPQAWLATLIESLLRIGSGEGALSQRLAAEAFDAAPASRGTIDGVSFEWVADADSRLGPVLEAMVNGRYYWIPFSRLASVEIEPPTDLRDVVWLPAHLRFSNGGEQIAMLPVRYPGSELSADDQIAMARKTEWHEEPAESGRWVGSGQRVLVTDLGEHDLLSVRSLVFDSAEHEASSEPAVAGHA